MTDKPRGSRLARLEWAVNRYHCGPGVYGSSDLLLCLRLAGLKVVSALESKAKKGKRK